jgi:hypothetical protein
MSFGNRSASPVPQLRFRSASEPRILVRRIPGRVNRRSAGEFWLALDAADSGEASSGFRLPERGHAQENLPALIYKRGGLEAQITQSWMVVGTAPERPAVFAI